MVVWVDSICNALYFVATMTAYVFVSQYGALLYSLGRTSRARVRAHITRGEPDKAREALLYAMGDFVYLMFLLRTLVLLLHEVEQRGV